MKVSKVQILLEVLKRNTFYKIMDNLTSFNNDRQAQSDYSNTQTIVLFRFLLNSLSNIQCNFKNNSVLLVKSE